jgi:hypothetical protein
MTLSAVTLWPLPHTQFEQTICIKTMWNGLNSVWRTKAETWRHRPRCTKWYSTWKQVQEYIWECRNRWKSYLAQLSELLFSFLGTRDCSLDANIVHPTFGPYLCQLQSIPTRNEISLEIILKNRDKSVHVVDRLQSTSNSICPNVATQVQCLFLEMWALRLSLYVPLKTDTVRQK